LFWNQSRKGSCSTISLVLQIYEGGVSSQYGGKNSQLHVAKSMISCGPPPIKWKSQWISPVKESCLRSPDLRIWKSCLKVAAAFDVTLGELFGHDPPDEMTSHIAELLEGQSAQLKHQAAEIIHERRFSRVELPSRRLVAKT
jgi:hypothetical protein